jgi:hypothetical protein
MIMTPGQVNIDMADIQVRMVVAGRGAHTYAMHSRGSSSHGQLRLQHATSADTAPLHHAPTALLCACACSLSCAMPGQP